MYTIIGSLVRHVSTSEFARISFTIQYGTQLLWQTQRGFDLTTSDVVDRSINRAQRKFQNDTECLYNNTPQFQKKKKKKKRNHRRITESVKTVLFSRVYAFGALFAFGDTAWLWHERNFVKEPVSIRFANNRYRSARISPRDQVYRNGRNNRVPIYDSARTDHPMAIQWNPSVRLGRNPSRVAFLARGRLLWEGRPLPLVFSMFSVQLCVQQ